MHPMSSCQQRFYRQQGQAVALGLCLIVLLAIALIYQLGVGQVAARKARLVHAVDAAAYSGALVQARALNMQAYINLAQTAHQVAMAHLVTLGSWGLFGASQGRQFSLRNPPAHVIGMMFGSSQLSSYSAASRAQALKQMAGADGALSRQFAEHDRIVRKVLYAAAQAVHNAMPSSRNQTIHRVLVENFPQARVAENLALRASYETTPAVPERSLLTGHPVPVRYPAKKGLPLLWTVIDDLEKTFTVKHLPTDRYRSFIEDVIGAYDFLGTRDYTEKNPWVVYYSCPHLRHELRRRGRTVLDGGGNWQSTDTLSYHALRSNKYIGCYYREYPMGWGWVPGKATEMPADMPYHEDAPDNFGDIDFWRWVSTATNWDIFTGQANPLANSRAVVGRQRWSGGGLSPYFTVRQQYRDKPLGFTLNVVQRFEDQPDLHAVSSAETFFEHAPDRRHHVSELQNLWHPFWQAHLVDQHVRGLRP